MSREHLHLLVRPVPKLATPPQTGKTDSEMIIRASLDILHVPGRSVSHSRKYVSSESTLRLLILWESLPSEHVSGLHAPPQIGNTDLDIVIQRVVFSQWTSSTLQHNQTEKLPMHNILPPERLGSGIEKLRAVFLVGPPKILTVLSVASTLSIPSDSFLFNHLSSIYQASLILQYRVPSENDPRPSFSYADNSISFKPFNLF